MYKLHVITPHVACSHQLADVFTNSLPGISYDVMYTKLGMFDLYGPTWGYRTLGLSTHLGYFTFIFYIRTYALPFLYAILGFLALAINIIFIF